MFTQLVARAQIWRLAFVVLTGTLLSGCALSEYHTAGEYAPPYKRVERYPQRDFFHRFTREAYNRPKTDLFKQASVEQRTVMEELGEPDWVRDKFTSLQGEPVTEWLYTNDDLIFQFVNDALVYEGPMTDYEAVLLSKGYPDKSEVMRLDTGARIDIFLYEGIFIPVVDEFHFINGVLVQSQEGN